MKTTQTNMLASLLNVQAFLQTNATTFAGVVTTGTKQELDDAIVTLSGHASDQAQTLIEAQGATQTQESLRAELLQFHMAPINRIAKLKLGNTPELTPFRMPNGTIPILKLKADADGMAAAATTYSAIFIAAGLPADFIAQLKTVATAMVNARTARSETSKRRQGVTRSLQAMLTIGRRAVHVLDPLVRKVIGKDPGLLTNWTAAKRVPRTGSSTTAATPAAAAAVVSTPAVAPATPAASTPAAAQQSHTPTT